MLSLEGDVRLGQMPLLHFPLPRLAVGLGATLDRRWETLDFTEANNDFASAVVVLLLHFPLPRLAMGLGATLDRRWETLGFNEANNDFGVQLKLFSVAASDCHACLAWLDRGCSWVSTEMPVVFERTQEQ